jgi:hypothetical protein
MQFLHHLPFIAGAHSQSIMTRGKKILLLAAAILVAVIAVLIVAGPLMLRSFLYPKPRGLPQAVSFTTDQLLARLQLVLATNAPMLAQSLQPGLSDAQITALESEGDFRLSKNLKALYRWRNGMSTNCPYGLVPGHRFLPLEEVKLQRTMMRQELASATGLQRLGFSLFAGHRQNWVTILDDTAGDGYFYDPDRTHAEGSFFYHMASGAYYTWFPSLNNFLLGVIECYEGGAFKVSADGKSLEEDSTRAQKIWERLAKSNDGA